MKKRKERGLNRREFMGAAAAVTAVGAFGTKATAAPASSGLASSAGNSRQDASRQARIDAAELAYDRGVEPNSDNGDESAYSTRIGNFSKGLAHNAKGEVDSTSYDLLVNAAVAGTTGAFAAIPMAGAKLVNPQGGLGFDLMGPDSHSLGMPAPPALASAEMAAEIVELYWLALLRDIPFSQYSNNVDVRRACEELTGLEGYVGRRTSGAVTPANFMRSREIGCEKGPLISQFLLLPVAYGAQEVPQKYKMAASGKDYLTNYGDFLAAQRGQMSFTEKYEANPRWIRSLRDLATVVHNDPAFHFYYNASLQLSAMRAPVDANHFYRTSTNQVGFCTLGNPDLQALIAEACNRGLKAAWYQKWFVHRRIRPEAFAGRVHIHKTGQASYPLDSSVLNSAALSRVYQRYATYLLPQAYPEGCPLHPSYAAGHATIAGACVTILKAWFNENFVLPNPVVPNREGTALLSYTGSDAGQLTVGGELNKLAANVSMGRNAAGIHWLSDHHESLRLGEKVGIQLLQEVKACYNESFAFSLTTFDGQSTSI